MSKPLETILGSKPVFIEGNCIEKAFLKSVFEKHDFSCVMHFAAFISVGEIGLTDKKKIDALFDEFPFY